MCSARIDQPVDTTRSARSKLYTCVHAYTVQTSISICPPCREGISFVLSSRPDDHVAGAPPPYIDFLTVLGEFSNRLIEVDRTGKKGVLVYLQVS